MAKIREECGVFGIFGHPEASNITYLGLHALQHRGQESAGIVTSDDGLLYEHKEMGLVSDIFTEEVITKLKGTNAIGHVRYSTAGMSHLKNSQPLVINHSKGQQIAVAHNGNLTNARTLREELESEGSIFQTTTDTEVILHFIAKSKEQSLEKRIIESLLKCKGAYSLLFLTPNCIIACRDPFGFRPLVLGKLGNSFIVSSESCAFDLIEADFIREVEPGELIIINKDGLQSFMPFPNTRHKYCIFEHIYFARPDSYLFGDNVYKVRKEFGKQLAIEQPADADIVIAVPDSGVPAAIGYSEQSGLPLELGLLRSHYMGRTFIEPRQVIRNFGVKLKLNAIRSVIDGKRVVIVDDSIVRGTTSRKIVKMLQNVGAKEVHMRISSPPMKFSCYYGVDTPNDGELIANSLSVEEINKYITSDTLGYLSLKGILEAVERSNANTSGSNFCNACFTGSYPEQLVDKTDKLQQLHLFDR